MAAFVRLALVAVTVGLADSLTPEIVGPALYLATVPKRVRRVAEFTLGVFCLHFVAGVILVTGPRYLRNTPVATRAHPAGAVDRKSNRTARGRSSSPAASSIASNRSCSSRRWLSFPS
jgi:hypothetical protein